MANVHPIENPATVQWDRPLTHSDYNKMSKGFKPNEMEDRWMILIDTPGNRGDTVVHIYRSWTGHEQLSLAIAAGRSNETEAKGWATMEKISWNENSGETRVTEEVAKEAALNLCKGLWDCALEE